MKKEGLWVILFDTRNLSPEQKREVYAHLEIGAFMTNYVAVDNSFAGYLVHYEDEPSFYLAHMPHKCPYKDVSSWDLSEIEVAFRAAFMV